MCDYGDQDKQLTRYSYSYWKGGERKGRSKKNSGREGGRGGRRGRRERKGEGLLTRVVLSGNSSRVPTATSKTRSVPSRCSTSDWRREREQKDEGNKKGEEERTKEREERKDNRRKEKKERRSTDRHLHS